MSIVPAVAHPSPHAAGHRGDHHHLAPLQAHLCAPSLDRQLAAGIASWRTPVHAARACQLTGERSRRSLARSLERLVEEAERPPSLSRVMLVLPSRAAVREARPLLLTLAARLRASSPVDARGMAALRVLLTDGAGPLYTNADADALARRLAAVQSWLAIVE